MRRQRSSLALSAATARLRSVMSMTVPRIGLGRPSEILPPSGTHPLEQGNLTDAIDGGSLYGTVNLGGAGNASPRRASRLTRPGS